MEKRTVLSIRNGGLFFIVMALLAGQSVNAVTHVVRFGGNLGNTYSPSSFSAMVGDTVKWEGDFSFHPLSSTSVPNGAATWTAASGRSFVYVINKAGAYQYICDVHFGMRGTFTATTTAVFPGQGSIQSGPATARIFFSGGHTFVRLSLPTDEFVSASLFTIAGRKLTVLAGTCKGPGVSIIPLPDLKPGVFIARVIAGKQQIILKTM